MSCNLYDATFLCITFFCFWFLVVVALFLMCFVSTFPAFDCGNILKWVVVMIFLVQPAPWDTASMGYLKLVPVFGVSMTTMHECRPVVMNLLGQLSFAPIWSPGQNRHISWLFFFISRCIFFPVYLFTELGAPQWSWFFALGLISARLYFISSGLCLLSPL